MGSQNVIKTKSIFSFFDKSGERFAKYKIRVLPLFNLKEFEDCEEEEKERLNDPFNSLVRI